MPIPYGSVIPNYKPLSASPTGRRCPDGWGPPRGGRRWCLTPILSPTCAPKPWGGCRGRTPWPGRSRKFAKPMREPERGSPLAGAAPTSPPGKSSFSIRRLFLAGIVVDTLLVLSWETVVLRVSVTSTLAGVRLGAAAGVASHRWWRFCRLKGHGGHQAYPYEASRGLQSPRRDEVMASWRDQMGVDRDHNPRHP
jgi:hypothetical protein